MAQQTVETIGERNPGPDTQARERRVFRPNVDVLETESAIELYADMPGVTEQTVEVTLEREVLTIRGRVDWEAPPTHRPVFREFEHGDYERVFTLSAEVNQDDVRAAVKNGVLHLTLPKAAPPKARRIQVTGS